MTDLEQRLRAEFDRQASSAPSAAATERFALDLRGSHRRSRRRAWLIPAVAALVLIVPILTVLVHRHRPVTPAHARALIGIEWLLTQEVGADGTSHAAPTGRDEQTLRFDGNGGMSFTNKCNASAGKVTISADTLRPRDVFTTLVGCGSGDNAMSLLDGSTTLTWQLAGNLLTIGGPDGRKLIFTVRPSIYPLDYPGSPNVTVTEGAIGTGEYRVSSVKDSTNRVYVFLEARDAPGGNWTRLDVGSAVGWTGPKPTPGAGCETAPLAGGRYLVGVATARAARVIASSGGTIKLYLLPNTGGLQAYAGFIGSAMNGSTVSVYDSAGGLLGTPCHIAS